MRALLENCILRATIAVINKDDELDPAPMTHSEQRVMRESVTRRLGFKVETSQRVT
jgi:hypothetical protein